MNDPYESESILCSGWLGTTQKKAKEMVDLRITVNGCRDGSYEYNNKQINALRFRCIMDEDTPPEGFKKGGLYEFTVASKGVIDWINGIKQKDPDNFDQILKKGIKTKLKKIELGGNSFRYQFS